MKLFRGVLRKATGAVAMTLGVFGVADAMTGAAIAQTATRLGDPNPPVVLAQQQTQQQPRQQQRQPAQQGPRIGEVAGRYTVLREEDKDTLCMVTLSETARGSGYYRAQLAPACRDNGVVIFDPIGWTIDRQGHISLQARKGHKMLMERDANGVWRRMGADPKVRPLSLRRII